MRASRATLVALLMGDDRTASGQALAESLLPAIASRHPSRVLMVRLSPTAPPGRLSASVSALCTRGEGARYVCCEKIDIEAGPGAEPSLPGAILSLILGDLPLVLWAPREIPCEASWFRSLLTSSDRLVFDSAALRSPAADLRALSSLTGAFSRVEPADFEWVRLTGWRRRIAAAFDPPEARALAQDGFERVTFVEPSRAAPSARRARQGILADESPAESAASAASLLLKVWVSGRVRVRTFQWSSGGPSQASPPAPDALSYEASRDLRAIRFEGRRNGAAALIEVPAPRGNRAASPTDLVTLIGGQPDNPLSPRSSAKGTP